MFWECKWKAVKCHQQAWLKLLTGDCQHTAKSRFCLPSTINWPVSSHVWFWFPLILLILWWSNMFESQSSRRPVVQTAPWSPHPRGVRGRSDRRSRLVSQCACRLLLGQLHRCSEGWQMTKDDKSTTGPQLLGMFGDCSSFRFAWYWIERNAKFVLRNHPPRR